MDKDTEPIWVQEEYVVNVQPITRPAVIVHVSCSYSNSYHTAYTIDGYFIL